MMRCLVMFMVLCGLSAAEPELSNEPDLDASIDAGDWLALMDYAAAGVAPGEDLAPLVARVDAVLESYAAWVAGLLTAHDASAVQAWTDHLSFREHLRVRWQTANSRFQLASIGRGEESIDPATEMAMAREQHELFQASAADAEHAVAILTAAEREQALLIYPNYWALRNQLAQLAVLDRELRLQVEHPGTTTLFSVHPLRLAVMWRDQLTAIENLRISMSDDLDYARTILAIEPATPEAEARTPVSE